VPFDGIIYVTSSNVVSPKFVERQLQSYMALGATQDHKDSAVLVEADLKELAESLGQILRLRLPQKARQTSLRMTVLLWCEL
jgi:hypothetical protein